MEKARNVEQGKNIWDYWTSETVEFGETNLIMTYELTRNELKKRIYD